MERLAALSLDQPSAGHTMEMEGRPRPTNCLYFLASFQLAILSIISKVSILSYAAADIKPETFSIFSILKLVSIEE